MDKSNALQALRDIHLPAAVNHWPWAIGWYFLLFLAVVSLSLLLVKLYLYHRRKRPKQHALNMLAAIEQAYFANRDANLAASGVNEVLKRLALVYFPREDVAALTGDAWIAFLQRSGKGVDFQALAPLLSHLPYQRASQDDLTPLFKAAKAWTLKRNGHV